MLNEKSTNAPQPNRYGTEAEQRAWMALVLGLPAPKTAVR